jgi:hypothetical protein
MITPGMPQMWHRLLSKGETCVAAVGQAGGYTPRYGQRLSSQVALLGQRNEAGCRLRKMRVGNDAAPFAD